MIAVKARSAARRQTVAMIQKRTLLVASAALAAIPLPGMSGAEEAVVQEFYRSYIYGSPAAPGEAWEIAYGGRLYDVWWAPLEASPPETTHPAYPASGALSGSATWRCVACHGWDYRGRDGAAAKSAPRPPFKGIDGMAGEDPKAIAAILRDGTHRYTPDMIPEEALSRLALFVSKGQADFALHLTSDGRAKGDAERGRDVYQNVCAICHDYDGRAWISGEDESQQSLSAVASQAPFQALHKIFNGEPSADMVALRAIGLDAAIDVLTYAQSLD